MVFNRYKLVDANMDTMTTKCLKWHYSCGKPDSHTRKVFMLHYLWEIIAHTKTRTSVVGVWLHKTAP